MPSLDDFVRLPDGRRIAYAQWGPSDGHPILFFHGAPGSRLFCPDLKATLEHGVRFIAFDRAGYGRSDPVLSVRRYADFVPDVVELLDRLGLVHVNAVGWSGGGPPALALGALAPARVGAVTVVCSPNDQTLDRASAPTEVVELSSWVVRSPDDSRDAVRQRCQRLVDDPGELLRLTEIFDPGVLTAPGMREAFQTMMAEAGRNGIEGFVTDWIARVLPWGFDLSDISVPVHGWFGEQDPLVSPEHASFLAGQVPDSDVTGCSRCRHFVPVGHWPEILEQLRGA